MKTLKSRPSLQIPGFRKLKKTSDIKDESTNRGGNLSLVEATRDILSFNDPARSSISSLDTLVSVDSGIDCGGVSIGSIESFNDIMKEGDPAPRGRAPIASPEDDKLSEEIRTVKQESDTEIENLTITHDNSASSFCTLSDNNSNCDNGSDLSDSDSGSETDECLERNHSDSDSESEGGRRRRRRRDSYSDSDSDSDDDQMDYFSMSMSFSTMNTSKSQEKTKPSKKLSRSTSKLNLSLKKLVRSGSKLDLSFKKLMRVGSKSSLKGKQKKDNNISIPVLQESPRKVAHPKHKPVKTSQPKVPSLKSRPVPTLPSQNSALSSMNSSVSTERQTMASRIVKLNRSMDNSVVCDRFLDSDSDSFDSFRGSNGSSSSDSENCSSFRVPKARSGIKLGNSVKKLQRSKSDCSTRVRTALSRKTNLFGEDGGSRTMRQVLNDSPSLKVRSHSLMKDPYDIDIDTCKSPMEVRQAMEKTAFWIENNDYDKTPDISSTESLVQSTKDVTETDLCNQIIGIYFGEENDSNSSLSSSCLDNSLDTSFGKDETVSSVSSTPLETNLDDFTLATFVPPTHKMVEAKTRKIVQGDSSCTEMGKENRILTEQHTHNSSMSSKGSSSSRKHGSSHQRKKTRMLNEDEIDTITKIHTICNGQRAAQYLDLNDMPMNFKHYPPPKRASRVAWNQEIWTDVYNHHTPPSKLYSKPKPILQQKPKDFTYPYQEDEPSPIVITKLRRSKSMPRKSREWPW